MQFLSIALTRVIFQYPSGDGANPWRR